MNFLGWLLGLENLKSIDQIDLSLTAPWAYENPFWVFLGIAALAVLAGVFYLRYQSRGSTATRAALAAARAVLLVLLLITLAEPVLRMAIVESPPSVLYFVFDGTDSMGIPDDLSAEEREQFAQELKVETTDSHTPSRQEFVRAFLSQPENNLIAGLADREDLRVEAFIFDGNHASQVRRLSLDPSDEGFDAEHLAEQISSDGQVTALGQVLSRLGEQPGGNTLAGVVLFSDFAQNSGFAPVGQDESRHSPAEALGVPIYTVGIGATMAQDLAVDVQPPPKLKRAERHTITVKLTQTGLNGESVNVRVLGRWLGGQSGSSSQVPDIVIGEEIVELNSSVEYLDIPFTPEESGRFEIIAEIEPLPGEIVQENNVSSREVNIIDDYLRLMYVCHEPNWEWRFVKEVFHRDKLVGMRGFRTYLASSDPRVRQTNELFLPSLVPARSEFFENDIIFLGDMPQEGLSDRFCEMTKEFVGNFGGGLVVIAGPRFGPAQLVDTPLADMLPVTLDSSAKARDSNTFVPRLTPQGLSYDFMQLGAAGNSAENLSAWANLGKLHWYQPVAGIQDRTTVLAEHPTDTCLDGQPQPIIAIRRYGRGEVVYIAFDEMWRMRRIHGERYYRQFWSQLINRLGLSHALGAQKRFVVRTDRQQYEAEQRVIVTVEAYDENFEPLQPGPDGTLSLSGELVVPGQDGAADVVRTIGISQLRESEFEARIPVYSGGEYRLRVKDPVTDEYSEVRFTVTELSAERRSAVRDQRLQEAIALESGGRTYDLHTVSRLPEDLQIKQIVEEIPLNKPLWSTPLWFMLIVGLMLTEWFFRKMNTLA